MLQSCNRPPLQRWFSAHPLPCPSPRGIDAFGQTWTLPAGGGDGGGGLPVPRLKPWPATRRLPGVLLHGACPGCCYTAPARGVPVCTAPARGVSRLHGACAGCLPSARRLAGVFRVCRSVHPCARLPTRAGGDGTTNSLRLTKTLTHPERPRNLPDACGILILEIAPAVPSRPARVPDEENRQWTIARPRHGGGFLLPGRSSIRASWQCSAWRRRSSWRSLACAYSPLGRTSLNASTIPTWDGRACRTWIAS